MSLRLLNEQERIQSEIIMFLEHSKLVSHQKLSNYLKQIEPYYWVELLRENLCLELEKSVNSLELIDTSLANIEMGCYGICGDCDNPIEEKELKKTPSIQRCINCELANRAKILLKLQAFKTTQWKVLSAY